MSVGIQDVSDPNAGRDQSGLMHKMLITQKYKLELSWWCPDPTETARILSAVDSEYFSVGFTDPKTNSWVVKTMYVGDRTAPVQRWSYKQHLYSKVSFNVIER